jgi:S-disulfanyl-L-cysteine oxidoreductase SoxD
MFLSTLRLNSPSREKPVPQAPLRGVRLAVSLVSLSCCLAAGSRSVWDGVYTKEQAARGKTTYSEECAKCHADNLMGGESAPGLVGKDFRENWYGRSVGDMLDIMIKTMPSEDPGTLSRRQYADLAAYILSANEFPAGPKELDSSPPALKDIRIENKK